MPVDIKNALSQKQQVTDTSAATESHGKIKKEKVSKADKKEAKKQKKRDIKRQMKELERQIKDEKINTTYYGSSCFTTNNK